MPASSRNKKDTAQESSDSFNEQSNTSQDQNNNGNIGREVDSEEKDNRTDNYKVSPEKRKLPNEKGTAENEEKHWSGNVGESTIEEHKTIQGDTPIRKHPKKGYNDVDNVGGISQEDLKE